MKSCEEPWPVTSADRPCCPHRCRPPGSKWGSTPDGRRPPDRTPARGDVDRKPIGSSHAADDGNGVAPTGHRFASGQAGDRPPARRRGHPRVEGGGWAVGESEPTRLGQRLERALGSRLGSSAARLPSAKPLLLSGGVQTA